ncbi:MAG: nucleoside permease [Deltaproteobacteria bacterium]|nr:nucleoside permease [Deltaproteobacteria bacterium]
MTPRLTIARLAIMMFMQYFVMGSTMPILSLYFRDCLGFTGVQIGVVLGMAAAAALVSPFVGAMLADRRIRAERLLGICHFAAAGLMLSLRLQGQFAGVASFYLAYMLVLGPTVPLTNAITFHHLKDGNHRFGNTRVFGTIGWVAVAWLFGFFWLRGTGTTFLSDRLPDALLLSALSSLFLAVYAFTLPRRKFTPKEDLPIIPVGSLRVLISPRIMLLASVSLLVDIVDRYYYFGTAPFLHHLGFSDSAIMPSMSLGQIVEIVAMVFLATLIKKIGIKLTMIIGILAEIWRFVAFAIGSSSYIVISGIACHGVAYVFFFTTVFITIDNYCDDQTRTGLHQLFSIIVFGVGRLLSNLLAGSCFDFFVGDTNTVPNYPLFWMIPAALSTISLFAVVFAFKEKSETRFN